MTNDNMWKTCPCRNCMVKKICEDRCFPWPHDDTDIDNYVIKNQLKHVCLSCGSPNANHYYDIIQWKCDNCRFGI